MNYFTIKEIGVMTIRVCADGSGNIKLDFSDSNGESSRIITGFNDGAERRIGEEVMAYAHDMFKSNYSKA